MSSADKAVLDELRAVLQDKLRCWEKERPSFLPGLLSYMASQGYTDDLESETGVEDATLWLPSSIPARHRKDVCAPQLPLVESRLRAALCHDTLDEIRYAMRVKSRMIQFKNQNISGQREGIRSRVVIDKVHERVVAAVSKYRMNHRAKRLLDGPGDWEQVLRELRDEDVRSYVDAQRVKAGPGRLGTNEDTLHGDAVVRGRDSSHQAGAGVRLGPEEEEPQQVTNQTRKELSWIWTTSKSLNIDDDTDADDRVLKSEWCKSRACSMRSREEVAKVRESMRRSVRFLEWKARWWRDRASLRARLSQGLAEGLAAYAEDQATLQDQLRESFVRLWEQPLDAAKREAETSNCGLDDSDDDDSDLEGMDGDLQTDREGDDGDDGDEDED
jgi:hypothetical protein